MNFIWKKIGGKIFHVIFLLILFNTAGFSIFPENVLAKEKESNMIINEIMWAGNDEWIELKNVSDEEINLSDWIIVAGGKSRKDLIIPENKKYNIKPNEFFVLPDDLEDNDKEKVKISLVDSGKRIALKDDKGKEIDETSENDDMWPAGSKDPKLSMEREGDLSGWHSYYKQSEKDENYGTLGKENSQKPKKEYPNKIRINEILPNPSGNKSENEYIEIYNFSSEDIDLENWEIRDGSKKGKYVFPKSTIIKKEKYLVIYRKDFKFALNNSDETVYIFDPNGKEIDRVNYLDGAKKDISYNFDGKKWHFSRFLTPEKENRFNNLPESKLKIEKKIYKNMLAQFQISAKDKDKDKLKFVWDFGDGRKSYKQNTSHKYLKKGTYQVSLKISDGSEEIFETFKIEVGTFPKSELKIVGVKANPKGKDTNSETIKIKNSSKKKIDLKGWSVATGWKESYNHPINKKLVLKPGETRELTRKYSAFTLNNKQTKIELRRPDGSMAAKIKYSKKEGIEDDEIYEKTENGWEWVGASTGVEATAYKQYNTEEKQNDTENVQTKVETAPNNIENTQDSTEEISDNQNNQAENNSEVQDDELVKKGEVLGTETTKESSIDNSNNETGFFHSILLNTNQTMNLFINFLVDYF